jgi:hemerythrin
MMNGKSKLINWSRSLSCGIKLIDEQHKAMVELVNEMFNHIPGNEKQEHEYLNTVFLKLVDYIKVHFATEEKIMISIKYPGYFEHKRAHDGFILTIVDDIRDFKNGKRIFLLSYTRFLKDWILSHIAVMDKGYYEYLKGIATRKADGRLSITMADIERANSLEFRRRYKI